MAKYGINNKLAGSPQALTSTYKSLLTVTAGATNMRRGKVYEIAVGTIGTPADNSMEYDLSRQTAVATGSAITPNPTDPADAACTAIGLANATAEGTITALSSQWYIALNQRATYRWAAVPGGELLYPATANAGFALRAQSAAYTGTAGAELYFEEQ